MTPESTSPAAAPNAASDSGWRAGTGKSPSLPEVHRSVVVPKELGFFRKLFAYMGPGFLVAVGYMDPGNWATDLTGGSRFGYTLLSVIFISNIIAIILQALCLRLGIVTGRDLAQACRDHYSRRVTLGLWILCEIAIAACDLAEVIGSAIALKLLFGIPMVIGVCVTAMDVLLVIYLQHFGFRYLEALVIGLIFLIGGCFTAEIVFSRPDMREVALGFIPQKEVVTNPEMLYIAIGILGATVMPHNLYLHSSIVQTRKYEQSAAGKAEAITFATLDSTGALMTALFINASILIVAGAAFHNKEGVRIDTIEDAHKLLAPVLGSSLAGTLFALALLASGQNSTLTGTLAGQIVMEGFVNMRMRPWLRRLLTRLLAITPAVVVAVWYGEKGTDNLLIFSQVILSLQLAFAVVPLILFTSDRKKMGEFVNPRWLSIAAWICAVIIIVLNAKLLIDTVRSWLA